MKIVLFTQTFYALYYPAHSLRASFVTTAKLNGADDQEVMQQTKHKTAAIIHQHTMLDLINQPNAAKKLDLIFNINEANILQIMH